jgi:FixJ family two-component response regulator
MESEMPNPNIVYIVDSEISVRRRLTRLLSDSGYDAQSFASADAFLFFASLDRPCCLLLDVRVPDRLGFALHERLRSSEFKVPVIFMTGHVDIATVVRAMKAGAIDFLTKPVSKGELLPAIRLALAKSAEWHASQLKQLLARERLARLTPREREVFVLVLAGKRNKQIAETLASQEATVKVHRSRLMHKLETGTLAELLRFGEQFDAISRELPSLGLAPHPRTRHRADDRGSIGGLQAHQGPQTGGASAASSGNSR